MTVPTTDVTDSGTGVVERPASVEEAADLLRGTRGPLLFRGAGTKQAWGGRPAPAVIVETTGLGRLLEHNPADMTVSVEAGLPLRDLQDALAQEGQWLAFDPPSEVAGATVGGLLATGDSGPRRLRYGGLRDLVIGTTLVLADGTVARAGGKVIKNVAGYDLSKMLYGSLGTLGLVAEVVLRLHPRPDTSATATLGCSAQAATDIAVALLASPLEPAAIDWVQLPDPAADGEADGRLAVRFEGTAAGVQAQQDAAAAILASRAGAPQWYAADEEREMWGALAAEHLPVEAATTASAATLPTRTPAVAAALTDAARAAGATGRLASRPALGLHTAHLSGPPEAVAAAFDSWRTRLLAGGTGASVLLRNRPDAVDALVDALGPAPASVGLMRSLKRSLDPDGRCAPGRLGSWT